MQNITDKDFQKDLAEKIHESTLNKLYDIDGLDDVSWWPLAPIWWILISIFTLVLISFIAYRIRKFLWLRSWQGQTITRLDAMQKFMNGDNAQIIAIELAEILKRVAIHKYSREKYAAVEGSNWLKLLKKHDRHNFDWQKYGTILTQDIYAPSNAKISTKDLSTLINATKNWVR